MSMILLYFFNKRRRLLLKKVLKIIPFICILVVSFFLIMIEDQKENVAYYTMQNYNYSPLILNEDVVTLENEDIRKLKQIADENGIILIKQKFDNESNKKMIYYSCDDLSKLLDEKSIHYLTLHEEHENTYASTENTNDVNQGYQIYDLLDNNHFYLYKFSSLYNDDSYNYGSYQVYYQDTVTLEKFYQQVANHFDMKYDMLLGNAGVLLGNAKEMMIGMFFCMILLLLLYFSLTLFDLYKKSKKLGCLKLLGFTKLDIMIVLLKKQIGYYVIFSCVLLLVCKFVIPNINSMLIIKLAILHSLLLLISIILFYIALRIVNKTLETSAILKNHSVLIYANRVCQVFKFILVSFLFLFTAYIFPILIENRNEEQMLLKNEEILKYAVFGKIGVENGNHNDSKRYLDFYNLLTEQEDISYLYADFRDYREPYDTQVEMDGLYNATVDQHYLDYVDLCSKDEQGNEILVKPDKMEYFIFPESKREVVEYYMDEYEKKANRAYEPYGIKFQREFYFYEDRALNSLDFKNENIMVNSPILRVIGKGYPISYFDKKMGIDVAGTGMTTALKFKIKTTKTSLYNDLKDIIDQAGLRDVLWEHGFISYNDYLGTQIANLKNGITLFLSCFFACMLLYFMTLFQTFLLYLETQRRVIAVKQSLGFSHRDIFNELIMSNLMITVASFIIFIPVSIFIISIPWYLSIVLATMYFMMDCILTIFITRILHFKNLNLVLKGR